MPKNLPAHVQHFDDGIKALNGMDVAQKYLEELIHNSTESLTTQIQEISDSIGRKPESIEETYDAPSLWRTIRDIMSQLQE